MTSLCMFLILTMASIYPVFKWLGCPVSKWHSKTNHLASDLFSTIVLLVPQYSIESRTIIQSYVLSSITLPFSVDVTCLPPVLFQVFFFQDAFCSFASHVAMLFSRFFTPFCPDTKPSSIYNKIIIYLEMKSATSLCGADRKNVILVLNVSQPIYFCCALDKYPFLVMR